MSTPTRCPFCPGRRCVPDGHRQYFCPDCKRLFDDDPDEGGTHMNDPTKRLDREERQAERRAEARRQRRFR